MNGINEQQNGQENRQFERMARLVGWDMVAKLRTKKVAVYGIGGVGGYVAEALARGGIGQLLLVDPDRVNESNINRQLVASYDTIGAYKTKVMEKRIHSIAPDTIVETREIFYLPETKAQCAFDGYDYVVDAVDTVTAKIDLIETAAKLQIPIVSCMGAGNKLDATKLTVTDIYQTNTCPLAKVMRRELKNRGIKNLKVVYSTEPARTPIRTDSEPSEERKVAPGSISYVPSVAGLLLAGEVLQDLMQIENLQ